MDVLRISTAGSVDDGKSTLIGRLLFETNSIPTDKLEAIKVASKRRGLDFTDLSLLTDGLLAEREQGITIDVAHIYFSSPTRRYIIADSPGHVEYTRNMITGSSNAQVSIILVDANRELTEQTFRHLYIASMLRIPNVIVCVNKMDLVEYDESVFNKLRKQVKLYWSTLESSSELSFIPTSSLHGDNICEQGDKMPWYDGKSLLNHLETVSTISTQNEKARFQVQQSLRESNNQNRSFTGKVRSGSISIGQEIQIFPSGRRSTVKSIQKFDEAFTQAKKGEAVSIQLTDDIDVSRGDFIIDSSEQPEQLRQLTARLCWLSETSLNPLQQYEIQHGTTKARVKVSEVLSTVSPNDLSDSENKTVSLNTIFTASIKLSAPLLVERYAENQGTGAFILIEPGTGSTVAVGFRE